MSKCHVVDNRVWFYCPGCQIPHNILSDRWQFNGDLEKPTFTPSVLVLFGNEGDSGRCHMFVTDGRIQYLSDCTHDLKDQTIEMEDFALRGKKWL